MKTCSKPLNQMSQGIVDRVALVTNVSGAGYVRHRIEAHGQMEVLEGRDNPCSLASPGFCWASRMMVSKNHRGTLLERALTDPESFCCTTQGPHTPLDVLYPAAHLLAE